MCFCEKKDAIYCFDSLLNNNLWSYSLPEGFKISSPTQIIDNLLFFDAFKNGNEEHFIVGLDINTGKIVWKHLYKIPYKEDIIAFTFSQKNKLCYAYLGNWYQIFNPISGEIIFEKKFDNDIDPYVNSVYDDKLWFVSGKYENCKFGYISLKTNEIELLQDFPQENDEQFDNPVFHEGKLYLRRAVWRQGNGWATGSMDRYLRALCRGISVDYRHSPSCFGSPNHA